MLQLFATFSIFACYFSQLSIFACKIGCFKSFTVKCAHECNLQRINATFAENKCNFLTLLLQQKLALLISFSGNNNIRAAQWADNPTRLRTSIPDTGTHTPRNDPPKKILGPAQPPPHRCRTFPLLPVQMGYGLCECGAETVDHVVLHCPIHRPTTDYTA